MITCHVLWLRGVQVWKGTWRGTPVAVKVLSATCQQHIAPAVLQAFRDEVGMLARLRHPNICLFLGASLTPPNRAIVTELVSRGSLWDVLRMPKLSLFGAQEVAGSQWAVPEWVARRILADTCGGLVYLHGHSPTPIIHRDMKSANLLLDDSFHVKVMALWLW